MIGFQMIFQNKAENKGVLVKETDSKTLAAKRLSGMTWGIRISYRLHGRFEKKDVR